MVDFATKITTLSSAQRARLAAQLCPLSFAQQRLWFLNQLEPQSAAYNIHTAVRLVGHLDVAAMEYSFTSIVHRHVALRTIFLTLDRDPSQVVLPAQAASIPIVDLSALPAGAKITMVQQLAKAEAQQSFVLSKGPLLRVKLLRLADKEHILLLTMHHIIADGWSMRILIQEFVTLYTAALKGLPAFLAELPIQYTDFAQWQRLKSEEMDAHTKYWQQQLAGARQLLDLPTDHPRPPMQSFRGITISTAFPTALSSMLTRRSQQLGVTMFMLLLAAFKILLYRCSAQSDIVVGTPVAGRNYPETEPLIGCFVNTLVLRTQLNGNPSFREVVGRVREVCLQAYTHQVMPFEKLVEELQPSRSTSYTPVFQVMFAFQNASTPVMDIPGLMLYPLEIDNETTKFDLSLDIIEGIDAMHAVFEFALDLFDRQTIEQLSAYFVHILIQVAENVGVKLGDIDMLYQSVLEEPFQADGANFAFASNNNHSISFE